MIKVTGIRNGDKPDAGIYYHVINYNQFVPDDMFQKIKQAIENALNEPTVDNPDAEITG